MAETKQRVIEIRDNRKEIMEIAERTNISSKSKYGMSFKNPEWIPTLAYEFMMQAVLFLNEKKAAGEDVELNMFQLFDMGITHRENDEAEKEGNFTPYLTPGQEFKLLVKDDGDTEE